MSTAFETGAAWASGRRGTGFARPLASSPFPRAAREKGEAAQPLRGLSHDREMLGTRSQVWRLGALAVELDLQAQVIERVGVAQRVFVADHVCLVQVEQRLVKGLHAQVAALFHDLLDLGDIAFEDQVGDQRRVQHDLYRSRTALAVLLGDQALRDHGAQGQRQIHQQLRAAPIRITSGAWRSVFLRAASQLSVSSPTSRCVTTQFLCGCTNSTGSSTVMMWPNEFS